MQWYQLQWYIDAASDGIVNPSVLDDRTLNTTLSH